MELLELLPQVNTDIIKYNYRNIGEKKDEIVSYDFNEIN